MTNEAFARVRIDQLLKDAAWKLTDGVMTTTGHSGHLPTRRAFGDVRVHLEFQEPSPPAGQGQWRGNSGLFLMDLYEVQILDSYANPTYADGAMGALYGQEPPKVIASRPPGQWQCLDVQFRAPRFAGAALVRPASVTVQVNGVAVQQDAAFRGPTRFGELARYAPHPERLPFALQDHDDSAGVAFRNIWALPLAPSARPHHGQGGQS